MCTWPPPGTPRPLFFCLKETYYSLMLASSAFIVHETCTRSIRYPSAPQSLGTWLETLLTIGRGVPPVPCCCLGYVHVTSIRVGGSPCMETMSCTCHSLAFRHLHIQGANGRCEAFAFMGRPHARLHPYTLCAYMEPSICNPAYRS